MTKTVLLTLGRLPKGLDIARSFHESGWRVIIADPARDHLSRVSNHVALSITVPPPATEPKAYLAALRDVIVSQSVDLVIPVSEEIMYVSKLKEAPDLQSRLFCMPSNMIHRVHDKYEFIRLCTTLDLSVPDTARADSPEALEIAGSGPFIIKPIHSCAGDQVTAHEAHETFTQRPDRLVQRRIKGQEISSCSLAHDGNRIATSLYRGTLMGGTVAVAFERIEHKALDQWIDHFIAETKWTGFIAFDFIVDESGTPYAIECNPRTTSGIHFFETADLAPAILKERDTIRYRSERHLMQFWSCMEELQKGFGSWKRFGAALNRLIACRDVTWMARDPLPLLTMPWTARAIIRDARRSSVPFGIAATRDLVWTEGEKTGQDHQSTRFEA